MEILNFWLKNHIKSIIENLNFLCPYFLYFRVYVQCSYFTIFTIFKKCTAKNGKFENLQNSPSRTKMTKFEK